MRKLELLLDLSVMISSFADSLVFFGHRDYIGALGWFVAT